MKKLLLMLLLVCTLAFIAQAQVATTIKAIQDTTGTGSQDSPFKDQVVIVEGVISAEAWAFGGTTYYLQDGSGPWSGIMVYDRNHPNAQGDSVRITGKVTEYNGMTEITNVSDYVKLDEGKIVESSVVSTGEIGTGGINSEAYEGVLVTIVNAEITNPSLGYGEYMLDDGSGPCRADDAAMYYFNPANHDSVKSLTGLLNWNYNDTKIEPRLAWDVVEAGEFTRIQRIQQVRTSDLLKAPTDQMSDVSYFANPANPSMAGDTVSIRGIVTMPTGLSYAGAGIKFILSEIGGGAWNSILSYHPDSTAYPTLYEGDVIEMSGYIGEYRTGPSNMTEFWITSPIKLVDLGQPIPNPDPVATGDLRLPVTAEQWGNCMVYVGDATLINVNPAFELYEVDDGTGGVLVDDDSDSLVQYYDTHPKPPLGTIADSIRGWLYHHYGSYADSTAYKLEPLYMSDIAWGAGPPSVSNVTRNVGAPTSSDAVTITAKVVTNLEIADVTINYEVITGGVSSGYQTAAMTFVSDEMYEGNIPAQAANCFVNYYVTATDNISQSTTAPADLSVQNYCYVVKDGPLSIYDIQYTPWELANSPFEGYNVAVTGIATVDTSANNLYKAYSIQDAEAAWSGVFVFGVKIPLNRGDEVTVYGKVTDYNPDYHYKWDNNTVILADSVKVLSSGNSANATPVPTGTLKTNTMEAEAYEGVLVEISNATLISVNPYDATFDDGSGPCLLDGDFMLARDQDANTTFYVNDTDGYLVAFGDTVQIGDTIGKIRGVFTFSFGTHKIELRNSFDFGYVTGVNDNVKMQPLSYRLEQNFPNPFNPETRIYFEIPQSHQVKVLIYNILGQKVRSLVNDNFNAGHHIINWDGRDDYGNIVPTGVYLYRIKAGEFIACKKMLMMK